MSFVSNLMNSMHINSDVEDDDYYDEDESFEEKPKRSFLNHKSDNEYDDDDVEESRPRLFSRAKTTPVRRNMEVSMVKPTSVEDSRTIVDHLLAGKAVVLNMEGLHTEIAQRIIDFTSGATYSMDGKLQKISNYIFIVTPSAIDLSGDFQDILTSGAFQSSGLNMRI